MDSAEVCVLVAASLELEYKDWFCCWWGCVGTDYESVTASGEVVGSLWSGEESDVLQGSGKLRCQTLEDQGSFESSYVVVVEPC